MDGTVGSSLRLTPSATAVVKRLALREGEILSIRIGKNLGKGRYAVTLRGMRLTIRSAVPLQISRVILAKVVFARQRVELQLVESVAPRNVAAAPAVPQLVGVDSATVNLLAQSMRRSGMAVTPESMVAITSMIPAARKKDPSFIRFVTILFDKHLHVDPEKAEELYLAVGGEPREDGGGQRGRQEPRKERGEEDGGGSGVPVIVPRGPEPASGSTESEGNRATLREELRSQLVREGSEEAGWWALFNHLRGGHEQWVIVPFRLSHQAIAVDGSLRLLLSPATARSSPPRLPFDISRAVVVVDGVGTFEVDGGSPKWMRVWAETEELRKTMARLLPALREKLRNLGVEVDDTINGDKKCDGFSSEEVPTGGVDAIA